MFRPPRNTCGVEGWAGIALTRSALDHRGVAQQGEKGEEEERKLETALHLAGRVAERGQMSAQVVNTEQ